MKTRLIPLFICQCILIVSVFGQGEMPPGTDSPIEGQWLRFGHEGPVSLSFHHDGTVEGDFGNDGTVEILAAYIFTGDRVEFNDREGVACPEPGRYRVLISDDYLSFDILDDNCGGRVKATMGFWVRPDYKERLIRLSDQIRHGTDPETYLNRGRMYLALGKSWEARQDFDKYIEQDPGNARAWINRASTRFPADMKGAVEDCSRAIKLDEEAKNAYFLRGLALYELGEKEEACRDFYRAISLGFSILREAESGKCSEIWKTYSEE